MDIHLHINIKNTVYNVTIYYIILHTHDSILVFYICIYKAYFTRISSSFAIIRESFLT